MNARHVSSEDTLGTIEIILKSDNCPKIDFPCNSVAGYMKKSTYHGGVFAGFISSLLLCFRVAKSIVDSLQIKLRKATSFLGWSLKNRQ